MNRKFNRLSLPGMTVSVLFLLLVFAIMVMPMWNVIVLSTSTSFDASSAGIRLWWNHFSVDGYTFIFQTAHLLRPVANSLYVAIAGTAIQVIISSLAGYVLIQKGLPFQNAMVTFIMLTMMIPGDLTLVSIYQLNKDLALLNTFTGLIVNGLISGFSILLMRSYFLSVPLSMAESAKIDGATELKIFSHIYLPISLPGIATISFLEFVARWNSLMLPATLISDQKKYTLPLTLKTMILSQSSVSGVVPTPENAMMAAIIISALPLVFIYAFSQKFLISGMTLGAVKE